MNQRTRKAVWSSCSLTPLTTTILSSSSSPPPLYALTIGIDKYAHHDVQKLRGAKLDADKITNYLRGQLLVPKDQITELRDTDATRSAILKAFTALQKDTRINKGDAIFIYYAGHGASGPTPETWKTGDTDLDVQYILSQDCHMPLDDHSEKTVQPIPDRTIGELLRRLAEVKGDNITVIFDCCHSGSGTRSDEHDPTRLARGFRLGESVPNDIDKDILGDVLGRAAENPPGFAYAGLESHVLLAACMADETALEEKGRGLFTQKLLKKLSSVSADRITYRDLMGGLDDIPHQNPQCEGKNNGRVLFRSQVSSQGRILHPVYSKADKHTLKIGAARGITPKSQFHIYKSENITAEEVPLGTLEVGEIQPSSTELVLPAGATAFAIPESAFALQTRFGPEETLRLQVAKDMRPELVSVVNEAVAAVIRNNGPDQRAVVIVPERKVTIDQDILSSYPANLNAAPEDTIDLNVDVVVENGVPELAFGFMDPLVTSSGLTRMYHKVQPRVDLVFPVLRGAAHFFWHLRRSPKKNLLSKKVRIEFTKVVVTDDVDEDLKYILAPEGENLINAGKIELEADDKTLYGMKVFNDFNVGLYASLFYFDCSDLSISSYYESLVGGRPAFSLPPKGSLTIGYGDGGSAPYKYFLRKDQTVDVGFLRLFLSTEPLDLSAIPQKSPFPSQRGADEVKIPPKPMWDAVTVSIVQHQLGWSASSTLNSQSPLGSTKSVLFASTEIPSPLQAPHVESTSALPT
ncbi:caspase domain-containing protein [Amylostereum chailletii]|nr:caspase domain-containing protein [Amylostereum chailletii]